MKHVLKRLFFEQRGATLLEYGLVAFLVALAAVAALDVLGETLNDILKFISGNIIK